MLYPATISFGENHSAFWYNPLKKEIDMSCLYSYNNGEVAFLASDSLSVKKDDNGKRIGESYISKIIKKNDILIGIYGQTTYKNGDINDIINSISFGFNPVGRLKNLADELKPEVKENLGFVILYIKDGRIRRHVIEVGNIENGYPHNFSFDLEDAEWGKGAFHGTMYKETFRTVSDIDINNPQTIKDKIIQNMELDNGNIIGGPVQLFKISIENGIEDLSERM